MVIGKGDLKVLPIIRLLQMLVITTLCNMGSKALVLFLLAIAAGSTFGAEDEVSIDRDLLATILAKLDRVDDLEKRVLELEAVVTNQQRELETLKLSTNSDEIWQSHTAETNTQESDTDQDQSMKKGHLPISKSALSLNAEVRSRSKNRRRRFLTGEQPEVVGFTAYLGEELDSLGEGHTLHFHNVLLNIGNSYNNNTGVFTCPRDGLYYFSFFISTFGIHDARARLVVDGINQVDAIAEGMVSTANDQGGNALALMLTTGQSVAIEVYDVVSASSPVSLHGESNKRRNTFSGLLVTPL